MKQDKRVVWPLVLGLIVGGAALTLGVARWRAGHHPQAQSAPQSDDRASSEGSAMESGGPSPEKPAAAALPEQPDDEVGAASTDSSAARPMNSEAPAPGGAPGEQKANAIIKMEPLVANLDEGDQLRYIKISVSLEVTGEAQQKIQSALPRARHESIMYLSGLHLADTQGLLGKQRIHRELQRRIADAVGGGLKRVYFDEFVVQ